MPKSLHGSEGLRTHLRATLPSNLRCLLNARFRLQLYLGKSNLEPAQRFTFLDFRFDTLTHRVEKLTPQKVAPQTALMWESMLVAMTRSEGKHLLWGLFRDAWPQSKTIADRSGWPTGHQVVVECKLAECKHSGDGLSHSTIGPRYTVVHRQLRDMLESTPGRSDSAQSMTHSDTPAEQNQTEGKNAKSCW